MKFSKNILYKAGIALSAFATVIACNKSSTTTNATPVTAYSVCTNGVCTGSVVNSTANIGFYGENYYQKIISITNSSAYREFLKNAMGVCDQLAITGGTASCDQWTGGSLDVVVQTPSASSNTLTVIFRAWPSAQSAYYNYSYQFPTMGQFVSSLFGFPVFSQTGATRNPLVLNFPLSVTNNYQGFTAQGYGAIDTTANRSLIQVISNTGKLTDSVIPVQLAFGNQNLGQGTVFASGNFYRCQTVNCGW